MVTLPTPQRTVDVFELRERCKRLGVKQETIAAAVGVTRVAVVNALGGKMTSRRIIEMAMRMADEAERASGR